MGIFSRIATLIKSNINDLISRSEDPEKMLEQIILDMNEQLLLAKQQVAGSIADEKRLRRQADEEAARVADWEKKAMLAVRAGNDELAKEALARKKEHQGLSEQMEQQWLKHKQSVDQLKLALRALSNKIEEAKRKKLLLIARQKRAEAQRQIHETMSGLQNNSAFEAFDRMSSKVDQIEAQAEASAELSEQFTGDTLAQKFQQLEVTAGADEDLLALKRKMGVLPSEPEKPALRVEASPTDELEELSEAEHAELARALADLEADEQLRVKR